MDLQLRTSVSHGPYTRLQRVIEALLNGGCTDPRDSSLTGVGTWTSEVKKKGVHSVHSPHCGDGAVLVLLRSLRPSGTIHFWGCGPALTNSVGYLFHGLGGCLKALVHSGVLA